MLGKGDVRMRGITIRNNIIATNKEGPAIQISSPQKDLRIENNIFIDQSEVISVYGKGSPMQNPPLPSTISIRNNIFAANKSLFDRRLFDMPEGSDISIDHNLFADGDTVTGTNVVKLSIEFDDPRHFDFAITSKDGENILSQGFGPYTEASSFALWADLSKKIPTALPVDQCINQSQQP